MRTYRLKMLVGCVLFALLCNPWGTSLAGLVPEPFVLPQEASFIENRLSDLFLNEFSKLSDPERIWLGRQDVALSHILKKDFRADKKEFARLQKISMKFQRQAPSKKTREAGERFPTIDIAAPYQRYIISPAPLKEDLERFWDKILSAETKVIVTLVSPQEENKPYCIEYWDKALFPIRVGEWSLSLLEAKAEPRNSMKKGSIIQRTFRALRERDKTIRLIQNFHYLNWKDQGSPQIPLLSKLISLVLKNSPEKDSPIFVHCAAGIGRTGTFVMAHNLCKELWEKKRRADDTHKNFINIPERLLLLRMQRQSLVATESQYDAIYQVLRQFATEVLVQKGPFETNLFTREIPLWRSR